jgi:hypothetical protein
MSAVEPGLDTIRAQQQALLDVGRAGGIDLDAHVRRILEIIARTLGVERVSFWEYSASRDTIHCRSLFLLAENRHECGAVLAA